MHWMKKNWASSAILVQIIVIILLIEEGYALKCYVCNSRFHSDCVDIGKNSTTETCELNKMDESRSWFQGLNRITYVSNVYRELAMICQKMIIREVPGHLTTIRFCQLHATDSDACSIPRSVAKNLYVDIIECAACNKDNCNGTIKIDLSNLLIVFTIILLFTSKRFLLNKYN